MKRCVAILFFILTGFLVSAAPGTGKGKLQPITIYLYGDTIRTALDSSFVVPFHNLTDTGIQAFYDELNQASYDTLLATLTHYKVEHQLSDWLYYQLIRKIANIISPKAANYQRYTLYKWFLLSKSGYDATVRILDKNRLLFYVQSDENVYNIPYYTSNGKQYVCLNYHDYGNVDLEKEKAFQQVIQPASANSFPFSYKVNQLPAFSNSVYVHKKLRFIYHNKKYVFNIRLNPFMKDLFANYPVVDFESCFNIPLSPETYNSLIPELKAAVVNMDQKKGVDYLMHFTRYAFSFEKDMNTFGKEKRLAPEETLLYEQSDCEDRAALLFYLVKEIYDLPMITLLYPEHVTIAIQFDKAYGKTINYKGRAYSVCEPTPQKEDLEIGQLLPSLRNENYDIGYEYVPIRN